MFASALLFAGCDKNNDSPVEGKLLSVVDSRVAEMSSIDAFWQWTGMPGYTPGLQSWLDPVVSKFLEGNPVVEKQYVRWEGKAPVGNEKVPASGIVLGKKSILEGMVSEPLRTNRRHILPITMRSPRLNC